MKAIELIRLLASLTYCCTADGTCTLEVMVAVRDGTGMVITEPGELVGLALTLVVLPLGTGMGAMRVDVGTDAVAALPLGTGMGTMRVDVGTDTVAALSLGTGMGTMRVDVGADVVAALFETSVVDAGGVVAGSSVTVASVVVTTTELVPSATEGVTRGVPFGETEATAVTVKSATAVAVCCSVVATIVGVGVVELEPSFKAATAAVINTRAATIISRSF